MQSWKNKKNHRANEARGVESYTQNKCQNYNEDIVNLVESDIEVDKKIHQRNETNTDYRLQTSRALYKQSKHKKRDHENIIDSNASIESQRVNNFYRTPTKEENKRREWEYNTKNDTMTPDEDSLITHSTQVEGMKEKHSTRRMQSAAKALNPFTTSLTFTKANNYATNKSK